MPRRAKPIPTAGENPLLMKVHGSYVAQKVLKMVQPPFEMFLVPTWLRVPIWSGTREEKNQRLVNF